MKKMKKERGFSNERMLFARWKFIRLWNKKNKNWKELPFDDLTSIQEEAQQSGMRYGKYMAMKYKKEREK